MIDNLIKKFAKKFNVPIFTNNSIFPEFYATHCIGDFKILNEEYLFSSDFLKKRNQSYEIDNYLETTKYIFFSLGKGYLKNKNSIGLIYDPFVLCKAKGSNIVENDLLHILSKTDILQNFCQKNIDLLIELLKQNYKKISPNKEKEDILLLFKNGIEKHKNLLIADNEEDIFFCNIFEFLLKILPREKKDELKRILKKEIVEPNTIYKNLNTEIKQIFKSQSTFLDKFFDESNEEIIIELRIPNKYQINIGLIGIFNSASENYIT